MSKFVNNMDKINDRVVPNTLITNPYSGNIIKTIKSEKLNATANAECEATKNYFRYLPLGQID